LIDAGFEDTFRHFYPDLTDAYTYWSYFYRARQRNAGWRIDYVCISKYLLGKLKSAGILSSVMGSDHCPISLTLAE